MANQYEVIIRAADGDGASPYSPPVASEGSDAKKTPQAADRNVARYIASQTVVPMVSSAGTVITGNIGTFTGSKELQQRVDLVSRLGNTATGAFGNVSAATAMVGSAGLGLGIGLALTAVQMGISVATKAIQLHLGKTQEAEQLSLARQRYSPAYNGSRGG